MKKIFNIYFILYFIFGILKLMAEIFIKAKINNQILTNLDIKNEKNYLISIKSKFKKFI